MKNELNRRIGGHVSSSGGPVNAIQNTINIGGNCFQIFAGSPRMWARSLYQPKVVEEFNRQVKEFDLLPVFIHALYLTNLAAEDPVLRQKSSQAIITDMTNSASIGASGVVLHIGSHMGRGFDACCDVVVKEIKDILEQTPDSSVLLLENSAGQQGKIGLLEELQYILTAIKSDRLGVCIDTAHAFANGYEINTPNGLDEFIEALDKTVTLEKVKLLHLNDSKIALGKKNDQHENLGEGFIGKEGVGLILNHPRLSHLPVIMEVPGFEGEGPDAKNIEIAFSLLKK